MKEKKKEIIKLENMTMMYNDIKGVKNINFIVNEGICFGLLGPSGSGKSTMMRVLLGFIEANKGTVQVDGIDVWKNSHTTNGKIGFIPGEPIIPIEGTGLQYLKFYAKLKNIKNLEKMYQLIEYFELDAASPIKKMSKGMKQKVAIIACLMGDDQIYLLDEPTSGLDPVMQKKFIESIKDLKAKGKTIILSSHIMSEVQELCDEVSILKAGEIKYSGSMRDIVNNNETIEDVFWRIYNIKSFEEEYKNA